MDIFRDGRDKDTFDGNSMFSGLLSRTYVVFAERKFSHCWAPAGSQGQLLNQLLIADLIKMSVAFLLLKQCIIDDEAVKVAEICNHFTVVTFNKTRVPHHM